MVNEDMPAVGNPSKGTNGSPIKGSINHSKTEAPTNVTTQEKVLENISAKELDFVTIIDQYWGLHGSLMSANVAFIEWNIPEDEYESLIQRPTVKSALKERGIDVSRYLDFDPNAKWRSKGLSPLQLIVANALLDLTDQRSDKKKLQDLGVNTATYQRWLADPVFNTYLREKTEALLGNSQHEASLTILDKVKAGDLGFTKLYLEYTGRFVSNADKNGAASNNDLRGLMVKILEIVTEECDGPTAFKIAQRLKEATAIHAMAVDLTEHQIVVPDVAPMRELTPELRKLAEETGAGSEY